MGSRRGITTLLFGVIILIVGVAMSAPVVPSVVIEDVTAPAVVQRELSAGQWLIFENLSAGSSSVTRVQLSSSGGLSWNAQVIEPSSSLVAEAASTIDTPDGPFIPVAAFEIPRDGLWTIDISSDRTTDVMISPSLNRLNQLGTGIMIAISGIMTVIVGLIVIVNDKVQQSRKARPGVPIDA